MSFERLLCAWTVWFPLSVSLSVEIRGMRVAYKHNEMKLIKLIKRRKHGRLALSTATAQGERATRRAVVGSLSVRCGL